MIMITTVLAPILLGKSFKNATLEDEMEQAETEDTPAPDYMPTYPL